MKKRILRRLNKQGFTLVELLVAMAISGVVMAGIYTAYSSQQKSYVTQEQIAAMQQNLRAAMYVMQREIRMAGYDPTGSGNFGITDIRLKDIDDNLDVNGNSSLEFTIDQNDDGNLGGGDETVYYCIYDYPTAAPDGRTDLAQRHGPKVGGGGRQLLAENIEALGFAYAFDANGDGILDTYPVGGNTQVIWAVDSDADNDLDVNLDTNGDGSIDEFDGPGAGGNGLIAGTALAADVVPQDIRAVRIWMLARTGRGDDKFANTHTYTVGSKVITPNTDADPNNNNLRMRLLETTVKCRNMGL